ncbi:polynucleotide 5'-hydroxyl-kinase NOL9 [Athalia rosae]|uniref:polynucleotide 5'-hydroxyl-kinase NOL9 n=1 Tax=Athalia rosae TaxID=37344 RepID=UPI0020345F44|nr:polynucleotide 5'-hydroxyl-kinase NOL9 [Athalia rosae]
MTANGSDWKFKTRVKKMLIDKGIIDPKSQWKNERKMLHRFKNNSLDTLKRNEDVGLVKQEHTSNTVTPAVADATPTNRSKLNNNHEITRKQKVEKKKRRLKSLKSSYNELTVKKATPMKNKKQRQRLVTPKQNQPLNSIKNSSFQCVEDEKSSQNSPFSRKLKIFGDPTMLNGTPTYISKFPMYESLTPNYTKDKKQPNGHGSILNELFSDAKHSDCTIVQNIAMNTQSGDQSVEDVIDDSVKSPEPSVETEDARIWTQQRIPLQNNRDDKEEEEEKDFVEEEEGCDYESDTSFILQDEESDSNQINNDFPLQSIIEDSELLDINSSVKPQFYSLQNKVIASMNPSCKFYFNGKLRVKVLIGKVEIYGYIISKHQTIEPAEIYSPRGSSLVSIETYGEPDEGGTENLCDLFTNEGIDYSIAKDLQDKLRDLPVGGAIIMLENLENTLTKFLDHHYQFKLFPKIEDVTNYLNSHPKRAEKLLQVIFQYNDSVGRKLKKDQYREVNIQNRFLELSSNTNGPPPRILIAGGKSVGKSTTLRYIVNGLLSVQKEIIVVDFDPGQPEFTPPGCISLNIVSQPLTGPNYTHLRMPFHQLFIGDINVAHCVPRYTKAVRSLVDYLNKSPRLQGRTVVINTMGFCEGIGWDLMVYVVKLIQPSSILQITSVRSKNNYRWPLSSEVINEQSPTPFTVVDDKNSPWWLPCSHELHIVPSLTETKSNSGDLWEMEPRHQRELTLLAYLSQICKKDPYNKKLIFSPVPRIHETPPYSISMSKLTISLTKAFVPASHILATMNGNIVALCGIDHTADEPQDPHVSEVYPKTLLRPPVTSTCYGFGIVRGVDLQTGRIFINTPLSINELTYVNFLVGSIPLPIQLIPSDHRNAPYFSEEGADLPTSREPRRGYFRLRQRNENN